MRRVLRYLMVASFVGLYIGYYLVLDEGISSLVRGIVFALIGAPLFTLSALLGLGTRSWVFLLVPVAVILGSVNPFLAIPLTLLMIGPLTRVRVRFNVRAAYVIALVSTYAYLLLTFINSPLSLIPLSVLAALALRVRTKLGKYVSVVLMTYSGLATFAAVLVVTRYNTYYLVGLPATVLGISVLRCVELLRYEVLRKVPREWLRKLALRPPKEVKPFVTANLIMSLTFTLNFVAGLLLTLKYGLTALGITGAFVAAYGVVGMSYYLLKCLTLKPEIVLRPFKSRWYTAWFVERDWAFRLLEKYASKVRGLIEKAAVLENPIVYSAKHFMSSLITLLLTPFALTLWFLSPTACIAGLMIGLATSSLILALPFIVLPSKVGDRRRSVEDELPWFTLLGACLQAAGIPLYETMKRLLGKSLLPAIEREARYVEKRIMVLGRDSITAMEEVAREHPSRYFRDFILGYTSILRTGGDLVSYLESRVKESLEWLSFRFRKYADTVVGIGELLIALFTVFVSVFAISGAVAESITYSSMACMVIPITCITLYSVINSSQPRVRYRLSVSHFVPAIAMAVAAFTLYHFGYGLGWLSIAVVATVMGAAYGMQYFWQIRVAWSHESALEDFLRDVTEMRKIGLPPARAILSLAKERTYNKYFDNLLRSIAGALRLNVPLGDVVLRVPTPSWLTKIVLYILSEIEASGGGSPKVLEMLTEFVSSYNIARREMRSKVRIYDMLCFLTPVVLSFFVSISAVMQSLFASSMKSITTITSGLGLSTQQFMLFMPSPKAVEVAKVLTMESSIAFAILASKAIDFTVKNTLRVVAVSVLMILYQLMLDPVVQHLVASMMSMP